MKALGFDPGAHAGWTALERATLGSALALGCGVLDREGPAGEDERVAESIDLMLRFGPDVVGVETVDEIYARDRFGVNMAGHIMRAERLGGRIIQAAIDHGFRAVEVNAAEWRRRLTGNGQAEDAVIARAVRLRVKNWPRVSNEHERDAAGVTWKALEDLFLASRGLAGARR